MLLELWMEAGLPTDAISVVQTQRDHAAAVTEALIANPAIRKVEFVGSAPVGRIIGSLAGKYLKPILMELGGKCAAVVLEDAELQDAADKCITGGKFSAQKSILVLLRLTK
jgi:acyl-CoA reductase-like NAD-dependent aldehyde dehydrogenase